MEFQSIFRVENDANLWAVCYPEHKLEGEERDVFSTVFDLLNNDEYLQNFFIENESDLLDPFWESISIDEAMDKVKDERDHLENELYCIEHRSPGYENATLQDVFEPLHHNSTSIRFNKDHERKGKPDFSKPMIRIYGIELEDATIIVSGIIIKLTKTMAGTMFDHERANLEKLRNYLNQEGITTKEGLYYQ